MNKELCIKVVNEIILYYDAWSKKHQINRYVSRMPRSSEEKSFYSVKFRLKFTEGVVNDTYCTHVKSFRTMGVYT